MLLPIVTINMPRKRTKIEYSDFMHIYERVCQLKDVDVYIAKNWGSTDFLDENLFEMHIKYKNDNFIIGWNEFGSSIFINENGLLANSPWHNGGYYDMKYYCDGEILKDKSYNTHTLSVCQMYSNFQYLEFLYQRVKSYL
jgi:hypothetical protein